MHVDDWPLRCVSVVAGACPPPSTQTRVWSTERSRCRRSKGTGLMERLCLLAALYWLNEAMTFKWNSPENPRSKQPVYFDIGLLPRSWKVNLLVYFQTRGVSLFIFYRHTLIRIYSDPKSWSQFQYIFAFCKAAPLFGQLFIVKKTGQLQVGDVVYKISR